MEQTTSSPLLLLKIQFGVTTLCIEICFINASQTLPTVGHVITLGNVKGKNAAADTINCISKSQNVKNVHLRTDEITGRKKTGQRPRELGCRRVCVKTTLRTSPSFPPAPPGGSCVSWTGVAAHGGSRSP